jgi:tRNA threonylcarbamoyladenosine biosynthesis protein TsaE
MQPIFLADEAALNAYAAECAASAKAGQIHLLQGPLGAGKTSFARAFIRSLCGPDTDVPSPTFTLVQTYDTPHGTLWHFDLYRLEAPDEIFALGWEEAQTQLVLVEWPERLGPYRPKKVVTHIFSIPQGGGRGVTTHAE